MSVKKFVKPQVEVEAFQFTLDALKNRHELFDWIGGYLIVDQGADNEFRLPTEYGAGLDVDPDAPLFVIINTRTGYERVSIGDWIVKYGVDRISVYDPMDFAFQFEEVVTHE